MVEFIIFGLLGIVAFYVFCVKDAPFGHEDETGFHYDHVDPADGEDE